MLNCEDFLALTDSYIDGTISEPEKALMDEHAASCDTCKQELEFALSLRSALRSLPKLEVPGDFTEKINARIDSEKKASPVKRVFNHIRMHRGGYSVAAACFVLAAVLTARVGSLTSDVVEKPSATDNPAYTASASDAPSSPDIISAVSPESTPVTASDPDATPRPLPTRPPAEAAVSAAPANATAAPTEYKQPALVITPKYSYSSGTGTSAASKQTPVYTNTEPAGEPEVSASPESAEPVSEPAETVAPDPADSGIMTAALDDPDPIEGETNTREREMVNSYSITPGQSVTPPGSDVSGVTAQTSDAASDYSMNKTVSISEEDEETVLDVLKQFGTSEGSGSFSLSAADYEAFLKELDSNGIVYTLAGDSSDGSDVVVTVKVKEA